jgi:hypothetical protein
MVQVKNLLYLKVATEMTKKQKKVQPVQAIESTSNKELFARRMTTMKEMRDSQLQALSEGQIQEL